jgi:ATP-dependent protease ClpP protease subunit
MARLLAARTGTDAEKWRPMLATSRGKRLTSAEAVEYGIIHALTPIKGRKARGK